MQMNNVQSEKKNRRKSIRFLVSRQSFRLIFSLSQILVKYADAETN